MDNNTFARRLMLSKIGSQLQNIMNGLDKASLKKDGDVSIIYEGKLPQELIKYLVEDKALRVEQINTARNTSK